MIMNYISILKSNTKIWKWYKNDTYAPVQKPNYIQLHPTTSNWRPTGAQLTPNWRPATPNRLQLGTQMAHGDDAV